MKIKYIPEWEKWFDKQSEKSKVQIDARLKHIEIHNYFGDCRYLGNNLSELRWKNGRRVYYTVVLKDQATVLLLGGFKNAQKKDIQKAYQLLKREASS